VAVDAHGPFVAELEHRARAAGLGDHVEARVGDMARLDPALGVFDLVWSEGAIFVVGFDAGLREWRRLVAPGGHVAVTEAAWLTPHPPEECAEFWRQEYPAIRDVAANLAAADACGYDDVGHFALPKSSWWVDYYEPLERNIAGFRQRHAGETDALAFADRTQREIDVWRAYADCYGYVFFVLRAR
jgi:SAM-dependent methyltransferase